MAKERILDTVKKNHLRPNHLALFFILSLVFYVLSGCAGLPQPVPAEGIYIVPGTKGSYYTVSGEDAIWSLTVSHVLRIDPGTSEISADIPLGSPGFENYYSSIAVGENAVWVADSHGFIYRIDPSTNKVVRFSLDWLEHGIVRLSIGEGAVWAVIKRHPSVFRIDPQSNEVIKIIVEQDVEDVFAGSGAVWLRHSDLGMENIISRMDPVTRKIVAIVELSDSLSLRPIPTVIDYRPGRWMTFSDGYLWVLLGNKAEVPLKNNPWGGAFLSLVGQLDPKTNTIKSTIDLQSSALDIDSVNGKLLVSSVMNRLHLIDPATQTVSQKIQLTSSVESIGSDNFSAVLGWVSGGAGNIWYSVRAFGIFRVSLED